jgi:hypothetical protein
MDVRTMISVLLVIFAYFVAHIALCFLGGLQRFSSSRQVNECVGRGRMMRLEAHATI